MRSISIALAKMSLTRQRIPIYCKASGENTWFYLLLTFPSDVKTQTMWVRFVNT